MVHKRFTSLFLLVVIVLGEAHAAARELVDYIDPMIGCWAAKEGRSHGLGKTFPGPCAPFGMVQLSPDTITGGDYAPGYCYTHDKIEGFSFMRMEGAGWFGEFGNLQTMATTGEELRYLRVPAKKHKNASFNSPAASAFSHEREEMSAGYYSVMLDDYKIRTELTAAGRSGMIRFTYPEAKVSRIQIDLARRIGLKGPKLEFSEQFVEIVDAHSIQGWMRCSEKDGGWGRGGGKTHYTLHFVAHFDRAIENWGFWDAETVIRASKIRSNKGKNTGFFFEFPTAAGEQVMMKAGFSFVDIDGARANLKKDIPDWNFAGVHQRTRKAWSNVLDGVAVKGGSEDQKTIFATALYHAFIDPRSISDYDGRFVGADLKVHTADGFTQRSLFSGWDVYRSQHPMLCLLRPEIINDSVNSLIKVAQLSGNGYLPRWEMLGFYSGCMQGDPAVITFTEAYKKGIRNYNVDDAWKAVRLSVLTDGIPKNGRKDYNALGYHPKGLSRTLELTYADYCASRLAKDLGHDEDAEFLLKRSMNYHLLYDPSVHSMRSKDAEGKWMTWTELTDMKHPGTVESNAYQQGWFVPHDVQGLINLMGGEKSFLEHLEPFFELSKGEFTGWNLYYNHANEPVHHVPYLFAYAGKPWLTQKWVRIILDKAYRTGVRGLPGNEDLGQMSAWYILNAIGFHPVDPVSEIYVFGSPIFDEVVIRLDKQYHPGERLTVRCHNNGPDHSYIQAVRLNGKPLERHWIHYDELVAGGLLEFDMGPKPNTAFGSAPEHRPPSLSAPTE